MRFTVISLFPEMLGAALAASVTGRAQSAGILTFNFVNPRDFTNDRHRTVDDTPYGGGPGMVMKVEPLAAAIEAVSTADPPPHRVLLSPRGTPLTHSRVRALAEFDHIALVCGRYEGIDERVCQLGLIDEELSIGDYVLSGGEIAALAVIDAVSRHVPGVLGEAASIAEESFADALLEYPQYTRPAVYRGLTVPEVLLSGHHGRIAEWRRARSLALTAERRPDLLARQRLSHGDRKLINDSPAARLARRTSVILLHYPVYDRAGQIITTAITNLDLHDIARSVSTYGIGAYYVVTPVAAQRDKIERILDAWQNSEQDRADNRIEALGRIRVAASLEDVTRDVAEASGHRPIVVATSARPGREAIEFNTLHRIANDRANHPMALVFGTGWGLSQEVIDKSDQLLRAVCGPTDFNHLSVRSAVAVVLDRLFGLRES